MDLNQLLIDFRREIGEPDQLGADYIESEQRFKDQVLSNVRPATIDDYKEWLAGYLLHGGKPTHYYNYPFPRDTFYVAKMGFDLPARYGAGSISVIIPAGIQIHYKQLGHNKLYYLDGWQVEGRWIPVYKDIKF